MKNSIKFKPHLTCLYLFISFASTTSANQSFREPEEPKIKEINLTSVTYEELHKVAIEDQVKFHKPALKSLHSRNTKSLNGVYDFCLDVGNQGFGDEWYKNNLKSSCKSENFFTMPVPSAFNDIASDRRVREYVGWFWYQTLIDIHQISDKSNQWFVQFANVNYLSLVWAQKITFEERRYPYSEEAPVHLIGSHVGGHLPFRVNLTDTILFDGFFRTTTVRLTIAVSNMLTNETIPSGKVRDLSEETGLANYRVLEPDFDFFFYTGIMGDVDLINLPPTHFSKITLMSTNQRYLELEVCVEMKRQERYLYLRPTLIIVSNKTKMIDLSLREYSSEPCMHLNITLEKTINQWLLESMSEYSALYISLALSSRQTASHDVYRMKIYTKNDRPVINNLTEKGQLQGFGMHMEQLFSGRYMSQASILKDIYLLKQMGANIIRTSHYPYSEEFLDACDEHGIKVIGECAAVGLNSFSEDKLKLHKQLLLEMMERDHHHPSIVFWSVANEPESQLPTARRYFESLLEFTRNNLSTYVTGRPLTAAIAQAHNGDTIGDLLDVVMVNRYYGWYEDTGVYQTIRKKLLASLRGWADRLPGKPLILSEFGADTISGLHSWTGSAYSEEYQVQLMAQYESLFDELAQNRSRPNSINFLGSLVWNFADFSTQQSLMRIGGRNRKGLFTFDREPKAAALFVRQVYQSRLSSSGVVANASPCYNSCPRRMR